MLKEQSIENKAFGEALQNAARSGLVKGIPASMDRALIDVNLEGVGESYAVWSLTDGRKSCMLRIPRVPLEQMPHPMEREFRIASKVPTSVGPRALYFEPDAENPLGTPYIVSEFTPGGTKREGDWHEEDFDVLVPTLVDLHSGPRWDVELQEKDIVPVDLVEGFRRARAWWTDNAPEIACSAEVVALGNRVDRFISARAWASENVESCAIHSDLCATNIVFDSQNQVKLIDWEWAENGDPAKDLAYVGGEAYCDPWYVPMSRAQVKRFVRNYLTARHPELSADALENEYRQLLARRDSWEAWERYTMGLHCMRRGRDENDAFYRSAAEQMHSRLEALLDREEGRLVGD